MMYIFGVVMKKNDSWKKLVKVINDLIYLFWIYLLRM